jgi:tetratricopeptide (TPR) repeat protein
MCTDFAARRVCWSGEVYVNMKLERSTWVAGIILGVLTIALVLVVLAPVNVLQENAEEMHKVHPNAEGLEKTPQGFMVMPFEGRSEHVATVHDLLRNEKETAERDFILTVYDTGDIMLDSGKYKEAIAKLSVGIDLLDKLEREHQLDRFGTPESVAAHRADFYGQRAYGYLQLKQWQKGIDDINIAIRNRPDYDILYENRARAYDMIGKHTLAEADRVKARQYKGLPKS